MFIINITAAVQNKWAQCNNYLPQLHIYGKCDHFQ